MKPLHCRSTLCIDTSRTPPGIHAIGLLLVLLLVLLLLDKGQIVATQLQSFPSKSVNICGLIGWIGWVGWIGWTGWIFVVAVVM